MHPSSLSSSSDTGATALATRGKPIEAAPDGRVPIAVVRDDRAEATVTLLLDDFLDLVSEWWGLRTR